MSVSDYRAVLFDRDETLCTSNARQLREREQAFAEVLGHQSFRLTHDDIMQAFWQVWELPGMRPVNTLQREDAFWREVYRLILADNGFDRDAEAKAADLFGRYRQYEMNDAFPDAAPVLRELRARSLKLGVISNTFPSVRESLQAVGLAEYFDAFTASSVVGASKPKPEIYYAAADALGVTPQETLFVDDVAEYVDAARQLGFAAFRIDRTLVRPDWATWTVGSLTHLLDFLNETNR